MFHLIFIQLGELYFIFLNNDLLFSCPTFPLYILFLIPKTYPPLKYPVQSFIADWDGLYWISIHFYYSDVDDSNFVNIPELLSVRLEYKMVHGRLCDVIFQSKLCVKIEQRSKRMKPKMQECAILSKNNC